MRPVTYPTFPEQVVNHQNDGVLNTASGKHSASAPKLPPLTGEIFLPNFDRPLTRETYKDQIPEWYEDRWLRLGKFMFEGVIPDSKNEIEILVYDLRFHRQFEAIEFLLKECPPVKEIKIYDSPAFTINDTATFAAILRATQRNISKLSIDCYEADPDVPNDLAGDRRLRLVFDAFDDLRDLKVAHMSGTSMESLAAFIKSSKTLQSLKIVELRLDQYETGEQFTDALASSTSIENIYLSPEDTSSNFWSNLLRSLATPALSKRLKSLDIFLGDFDPYEHLHLIVEFLYKATALEHLNLNNIADWNPVFPQICQALIESPAPLNTIAFDMNDEESDEFPCECFVSIADLARRRTGLRKIEIGIAGPDDGDYFELDNYAEDSPTYKNFVDKRTSDALISLRNSLVRNQTLIDDEKINKYADKIVKFNLPNQENLNIDVARVLVRHLLAHSASVAEFEQVMNIVLETVAIKRSLVSAQSFTNAAPTSTAAVSNLMLNSSN